MDIMGRIPAGTEKEPASLSLWFLIRIALKATIILTFPKYTPVMLVQG